MRLQAPVLLAVAILLAGCVSEPPTQKDAGPPTAKAGRTGATRTATSSGPEAAGDYFESIEWRTATTGNLSLVTRFELAQKMDCWLEWKMIVRHREQGPPYSAYFENNTKVLKTSLYDGTSSFVQVHQDGVVDVRETYYDSSERLGYGGGGYAQGILRVRLSPGTYNASFHVRDLVQEQNSLTGNDTLLYRFACESPVRIVGLEGGRRNLILYQRGFNGTNAWAVFAASVQHGVAFEHQLRDPHAVFLMVASGYKGQLQLSTPSGARQWTLGDDMASDPFGDEVLWFHGPPGTYKLEGDLVGGPINRLTGVLAGVHPVGSFAELEG